MIRKINWQLRLLAFAIGVMVMIFWKCYSPNPENPKLIITGKEEVVFDWSRDHCEVKGKIDVPDAPARAFRNNQGKVFLLAVNSLNIPMLGTSLNNVKRTSCRSLLKPIDSSNPSTYTNDEWLTSVYTPDGKNILMLIHNEYHGWEYSKACAKPSSDRKERDYLKCWYLSVTFVESSDGGQTFIRQPAPNNIVANVPDRYLPNMGRIGPHAPSNIVKSPIDNHYYVLILMSEYKNRKRGVCVLRGQSLDPLAWRAWDGKGFNIDFIDPYTEKTTDPEKHICQTVVPEPLYSLTYNTYIQKYIAIGQRKNLMLTYRLSEDLVHWSSPQKLMDITTIHSWQPGLASPTEYYSLLDPKSPSMNFDITGKKMYLYFVRWHINQGQLVNHQRDLIRVPLEFR
jgi:hypothetical protein